MPHTPIIISLGGSMIASPEPNIVFLKKFREIVLQYIKKRRQVVIICGGGGLCRKYQKAAGKVFPKVSDADKDMIGVRITRLNAELVRSLFGNHAEKEILLTPDIFPKMRRPVLIGGGWKPGWSTDYVAVKCAEKLGASEIINISNIDYVYDKNPQDFPDAVPYQTMSFSELQNIVGKKWTPGANTPFDPKATALAKKRGLRLVFINGKKSKNIASYLSEGKVSGTVVEG